MRHRLLTYQPLTINIILFLFLVSLTAGCATPVGVRHLDPKQVQRNLTANILSGDHPSAFTQQILNRANLSDDFQKHPEAVLAKLHQGLPTASEADRRFALAELSYAHAARNHQKSYYLASAVYAYAFLFPGDTRLDPNRSDPRVRIALDLYNRSIAAAITTDNGSRVILSEETHKLPFGELTIDINPDEFSWGSFLLDDFVQAAELDVRGLRNRYRWPGIGAPLAATTRPREGVIIPAYSRVPPNIKVPVTAVLRIKNIEEGLKTGRIRAGMELFTTEEAITVNIEGRTIPIEYELSSAMAYTLEGSRAYEFELKGLFSGDLHIITDQARYQDGLFMMTPYRPGLIPVVFVHGTASSPARWAEMFNELANDQNLWGAYQFWVFTYNTGNPILYSAGILAEALRETVNELDPQKKDPALQKIVVIGHSQGGLLTKLTAVDSGDKFWKNVSNQPFEEIKAPPETLEMLKRSLFYTPIPSVKRVIYLATPHQGSYVAGGWIGRLVGKFIDLPFRIVGTIKDVITLNPNLVKMRSLKDIPRSTDNMDPNSPFIRTLSSLPLTSDVAAHSIIAVENPDDRQAKWTDGVVEYSSAHIEAVKSEMVVQSGHSIQNHPEAIEEVRRILLQHVREMEASSK